MPASASWLKVILLIIRQQGYDSKWLESIISPRLTCQSARSSSQFFGLQCHFCALDSGATSGTHRHLNRCRRFLQAIDSFPCLAASPGRCARMARICSFLSPLLIDLAAFFASIIRIRSSSCLWKVAPEECSGLTVSPYRYKGFFCHG